jgi:hypothetical protein
MNLPDPRPEQRWWLTAFLAGRQPRLCLLVLLVVALMPPEKGLGFDLCFFHRSTGGPCPGCGMTRAGSNLLRGNVRRSIDYHPFGLILHPILLGLCAFSLLPGAARRAFALRLLPWQRVIGIAHLVFWSVFVAFGIARWTAVMADMMEFPANWL